MNEPPSATAAEIIGGMPRMTRIAFNLEGFSIHLSSTLRPSITRTGNARYRSRYRRARALQETSMRPGRLRDYLYISSPRRE